MKDYLKNIRDFYEVNCAKIDGLAFRDRLLLLLGCFFVIIILWYLGAMSPLSTKMQTLQDQYKATNKQIMVLQEKLKNIVSEVNSQTSQQTYAEVKGEVDELNMYLNEFSHKVIPVEKMAKMLREILSKTDNLELVEFRNLPDKSLISDAVTAGAAVSRTKSKPENKNIGLFKQGIRLTFKADYFTTVEFLKHIEGLKWQIFLDNINYKVDKYPKADVVLELNTLSLEQEN